jgi:hypothetical protein
MSTAQSIYNTLMDKPCSAVTLAGGYAMCYDGSRPLFEPCHEKMMRRNKDGRCTYLLAEYKDGSELLFTWSDSKGANYKVMKATIKS